MYEFYFYDLFYFYESVFLFYFAKSQMFCFFYCFSYCTALWYNIVLLLNMF